jgi:uncharacterized protein
VSLDLRGLIAETPWLDTHEHLPEEALRLEPPVEGSALHPCDDWAYLLWHYALDDLVSAGLTGEQRRVFVSPHADPEHKWDAVADAYARTRHSSYVRAARDSIRDLFGLELGRDSVAEIDRRMGELRRPGFYRRVLDVAGVRACQVNSLERTFQESADPERLQQDIGLTDFVLPSATAIAEWRAVTGRAVESLPELLAVMGEYFERFGPRAAAVKLAVAYTRPIGTRPSPANVAQATFRTWLRGEAVPVEQARAIEDAVIEAGLGLAADHGLAVKVHTGMHVGTDRMDLREVRDNVADVAALGRRFPTTFVLMHIGYPYEGEVIAAVKHQANLVADLCWAWIIDPVASREFLKRFLVTAPASKVLCFGGDYIPVENIVGHAALARRELARALEELVEEGYLDDGEARELVPDLMHGNAERIFGPSRRLVTSGTGGG